MNNFGEMTIEHVTTHERKTLRVHQTYPREVSLFWPLQGVLRFYCVSGVGIGLAKNWRIDREDLKALRERLKAQGVKLGPLPEADDGQTDIKASR